MPGRAARARGSFAAVPRPAILASMDRPAQGDVDELLARADALAAAWSASVAGSTTAGVERAVLRLFGVGGLDRAGRPLAAEVVDRHLVADSGRLGAGIAMPFAMAMAEYDLGAMDTALDAAAGAIDLALEAELLAEPDRRATAEGNAARLAAAALARIDANRLARADLLGVLGDARRPWVGAPLEEPAIVDALDELAQAVRSGVDLVRVSVPASRELAAWMARSGHTASAWAPAATSRAGLDSHDASGAPVPTGSQRALAVLRRAADELAAERGAYVRIATEAPALAAPEQAVVAAFERVDIVIADPMREIVAGRVDPDRALVDHAFAHRLLCRAGACLLVGSGPLVVARDLAAGVPSDPATRSGRALALQLLAARLAVHDGMPVDRVLVGALPEWLMTEPDAPARAAGEVAVRHALLPGHPLAYVEPGTRDDPAGAWAAVLGALLPDTAGAAAVLRRTAGAVAGATRTAASVALAIGRPEPPALGPVARAHASGIVGAALATIRMLEDDGWRAVTDDVGGAGDGRVGADTVAERTEAFDPFASLTRG